MASRNVQMVVEVVPPGPAEIGPPMTPPILEIQITADERRRRGYPAVANILEKVRAALLSESGDLSVKIFTE